MTIFFSYEKLYNFKGGKIPVLLVYGVFFFGMLVQLVHINTAPDMFFFFLSSNIWVPLIFSDFIKLTVYHQSEQPRLILYHRSLFVFSLSCDTQVLALLQLIDSTFQASDWHWQMSDLMIYLSVQTRKIGHSWQRRKHCFL